MANRYWVGGTATWDATVGTKWATTSGGTGGASAPTAADDVFFTNLSTGTCTLSSSSVCRSLNCTGFTGTISHPSATAISIGDATAGASNVALLLVSGMTYTLGNADTSSITYNGSSATVQTIDTGGKTMGSCNFATGGSWQLASNYTTGAAATFKITAGTVDFNGKTCSIGFLSSNNTNTRTITLGAASISVNGAVGPHVDFGAGAGLTLNAGTSTITINPTNTWAFSGGGKTYNNVVINLPGGIGNNGFSGSNTFANLTINATTTTYNWFQPTSGTTQTITTLLTLNGGSATNRINVMAGTPGSATTINAASVSLQNCDFMDIAAGGAASPWTGTSLGDAGGNSGITFTTPRTLYRVGAGGTWTSTANWALSSGGSGGNAAPLCQDTVFVDANASGTIGVGSLTTNSPLGKNIDFTGFAGTSGLGGIGQLRIFGSLTLSSTMTMGGSESYQFCGRGSQTITSAGKSLGNTFIIQAPGGTYTLADNFTLTTGSMTINNGTFNANGFNVTVASVVSNVTSTRAITMGSGTWTLTGNNATIWNFGTVTGLTFTRGNAIVCNYSGATGTRTIGHADTGETSCPSFSITAGADIIAMTSTRVLNLDFTGFAGSLTSGTRVLYGSLTFSSGMTVAVGTTTTTFSATSGTQVLTSNGLTLDINVTVNAPGATVQLADALVLGSAKTLTLTSGTFDANNKNVTVGLFSSTNTNVRSLLMGSGTWTVSGTGIVWTLSTPTNMTLTCGTSTLSFTDTGTGNKTFNPGGLTFNNISITPGGTGSIIIGQSLSCNIFTATGGAKTLLFPSSATVTANQFNFSGTAGNLLTIGITASSSATISQPSGVVNGNYLSISSSTATGGASFYAGPNSTDGGSNSGWIFTAAKYVITKSLQYAVKVAGTSVSQTLKYEIRKSVSITKLLQYTIKRSPSMTKSLTYTVRKGIGITKSLQYEVKKAVALSKSLQYTVRKSASITKPLVYTLRKGIGITKPLQYAIKNPVGATKTLKYAIRRPVSTLTKSVKYTIKSSNTSLAKTLTYEVKHSLGLTRGLIYDVRHSTAITKSLSYHFAKVSIVITKALSYNTKLHKSGPKLDAFVEPRTLAVEDVHIKPLDSIDYFGNETTVYGDESNIYGADAQVGTPPSLSVSTKSPVTLAE